ncbi:MAG: hypothetical protein LBB53_03955 [Prevotellaceae bacterium]|jgi:hypothetical protein|nr:hypothetical protein [Prevotellaceae bacterium]
MAKNVILDPIENIPTIETVNIPTPTPSGVNLGLSEVEERDPNNIVVSVSDPAPVVVLFGAGASGKTMTLVRLTRYLKSLKLKVEPDRIFRPSASKHYQQMCDDFHSVINDSYAPDRTRLLNFMLVKVMDENGNPICQVLEAPGEHYFNASTPIAAFPTYINAITQLPNRKIWMFIVEKDWKDPADRRNYANKICQMQAIIDPRDRVIFACHKADLHSALMRSGIPNEKRFFLDIQNQYPNIFNNYLNSNPITKLWRTYNFDFCVFSAGTFNPTADGRQVFTQGKDAYPAKLWNAIRKAIRGSWW